MKTSAARSAALEDARRRADQLAADPSCDRATLTEAVAALRSVVDRVSSDDASLLLRDAALRERLIEARESIRALQRRLAPIAPVPAPAPAPRSIVEELALRRCGQCDSNVLLVLRDAHVLTRGSQSVALTAVVCGYCGHARMYASDLEALRRAAPEDVERVELPMGEGPFRRE